MLDAEGKPRAPNEDERGWILSQVPTLKKLIKRKPPPKLYHYTSAGGLQGILSTRTLRAGNSGFMNDLSEMELVYDVAKQALIDAEWPHPARFLEKLEDKEVPPRFSGTFMFSLSEDGDSLEQWRSYTPPEGGYAIGLTRKRIHHIAATHEAQLVPCSYAPEEHKAILAEAVRAFKMMRDGLRLSEVQPSQIETDSFVIWALVDFLYEYAPVLKHSSFSTEREWRLVRRVPELPEVLVKFYDRAGLVCPYFELALSNDGDFEWRSSKENRQVDVIISPRDDPETARQGVRWMFENSKAGWNYKLEEGRVEPSAIPFRTR